MATLLKPNGESVEVTPKNGKSFGLQELYDHIGCDMVELVTLKDGRLMYVDEEAKLKPRPPHPNAKATDLLIEAGGLPYDVVLGNALIVDADEDDE
jgi:hypothetical protein